MQFKTVSDPGHAGDLVAGAGRSEETILYAEFNLDETAVLRRDWGVFRDRRPELYRGIASFDGQT